MKDKKSSAPMIDTGISAKDRGQIAAGLARLLADNYTLYLKTHNFHWNVTGPMFNTLHLMFETQYNELWLANDLIAERIRSLGFPAPGTYAEYVKLASIKETPGQPKAEAMVTTGASTGADPAPPKSYDDELLEEFERQDERADGFRISNY